MVVDKQADWSGTVKFAVPSAVGVGGGSWIIVEILRVLDNADAETLGAYTTLFAQLGTVPFISIIAMFIVVWGARESIKGRNIAIKSLESRIDMLNDKLKEKE